MATTTAPPPLRRSSAQDAIIGGVCAGIARRIGLDPLLVRIGFVAGTVAGGFAIPLYALCWLFLPAEEGTTRRVQIRGGRGTVEVVLGSAFLVLALLLAVRASGVVWFSDVITWPLVLVAAGGALIWRSSQAA